MRVIAGTAKGIQLLAVPGPGTRPISDRVKEAVFNILALKVAGSSVLDLYAGTGSVAIEALSRGAERAVLVEKHGKAIATIKANLGRTGLGSRAEIVKDDVFQFLGRAPEPFDLIYIAPPQYQGLWKKTLHALEANPGWLRDDGVVIVQIFPKEHESLDLETLQLTDHRKYGSTLLAFYEAVREDL